MEVGPLVGLNLNCSWIRMSEECFVVPMLIGERVFSDSSKTFVTLTFLVLPLQIQRRPVVVGGARLGGEVPAALGVGGHHDGVGGQSWRQRQSTVVTTHGSATLEQRMRPCTANMANLRLLLKASDWAFTFWR